MQLLAATPNKDVFIHSFIGQNIKHVNVRTSVRRLWTRLWRHLWSDLQQIWNIACLYHTEEKLRGQYDCKLYVRMRDH